MQNEARNDQGNKIIRSNTAANNFFTKQDQSLKASAFGTYTRTSRGCNPRPPNKHLKVKWTGSWSGAQSMLRELVWVWDPDPIKE